MESQPSTGLPRPSGIPKPASSRLPVLRSTGSQSTLRATTSNDQLRKKSSISSISRPSQTSALQKKSSVPSFARSSTPSSALPTDIASKRSSLLPSARRGSGIPSAGSLRTIATTTTNNAPVFKRPFARPPSRQNNVPLQRTPSSNINSEDDVLGSLDGFRSASRASSRAESGAGYHDDDPEPEHVPKNEPDQDKTSVQRSRPSLSDRTIESLSQVPASPAGKKARRRSSFFGTDNSMPPPLRPASAMSNSSRSNSRPTTSDGPSPIQPATPNRLSLVPNKRLSMTAPGVRSASAGTTSQVATPSRVVSLSRPSTFKKAPLLQALNIINTPRPRPLSTAKTMVARTPSTRPPLNGTFGQAISPSSLTTPTVPKTSPKLLSTAKKVPGTSRKVSSTSTALRDHIAKAKVARKSDAVISQTENSFVTNSPSRGQSSSNTLREQIAKAKEEARRRARPQRSSTSTRTSIVPDPAELATFDFGLDDDAFNQAGSDNKSNLRRRIDGALTDGRLNIAAMRLTEIPEEVLSMYRYDVDDTRVAWGEIVDLVVMVAADNELEALPDAMFPDVDVQDMYASQEIEMPFGAVQTIDLHGNLLQRLPVGLKRLTQLSNLNVSRNKLSMGVFDLIAQIPTLRELKLAENGLRGELSTAISSLNALEVLDLQNNKLTGLPTGLGQLSYLRSLNVSGNQLQTIPAEIFANLVELHASKNQLSNTLFSVSSLPQLQELHVANNAIDSFSLEDVMELPALKVLNLSSNRLASLPDVSSWINLHTLLLGENKLTALPEGFTSLNTTLRSADFTGNDITQVDERIALMEGLQTLTIAANPLRERKFLTMSTEDILRDLSSRLQPNDAAIAPMNFTIDNGTNGDMNGSTVSDWEVTPSGTLDLSAKQLSDLSEEHVESIADVCRQLYLQQNTFTCILPVLSALTMLTVLDLSRNAIATTLHVDLHLPKLRDLRLKNNSINSLDPLRFHLDAPALQILDISQNRLSGPLPSLRTTFPTLTTLLASDNAISEVSPEPLAGFKVVNLSNNNIERLEPRIGLLQGELTCLEVDGNKFRVPNYQILQKGTETVLGWLRDKIPRESWRSDGTTEGEWFDAVTG